MLDSPGLPCPICANALKGRQWSACSGRCRAALSRRRRILVKAEEIQALRALLRDTLERMSEIQRDAGGMCERLWEAKAVLEKLGG